MVITDGVTFASAAASAVNIASSVTYAQAPFGAGTTPTLTGSTFTTKDAGYTPTSGATFYILDAQRGSNSIPDPFATPVVPAAPPAPPTPLPTTSPATPSRRATT